MADDPMVTLNRAVALAHVEGPTAALRLLSDVAEHPRLVGHHRVHAVRAHLLQAAGRPSEASEQYRTAARLTSSTPERQYLMRQAAAAEQRAPVGEDRTRPPGSTGDHPPL
jgi:predicted RNA polymerase sigma factor